MHIYLFKEATPSVHQTVTGIEDMSGHVCLAMALIFCSSLVANQQLRYKQHAAFEIINSHYLRANVFLLIRNEQKLFF